MAQMNFRKFQKQCYANAWIVEGRGSKQIHIYVRRSRGPYLLNHGDYQLANMQAKAPGNGALTKFLDQWEPECDFYFEHVLTERLAAYLEKRGYENVTTDERALAPSYLRRRKKK